jgi:hypothetical protein
MATDADILKDAQEAFDLAAEAEDDNRKEALDDIRFARLGEQWPDNVKKQREREQRPCLTINRLPSFIRQVVNDARQNKPSIKCHPADDEADVETAEIMNGLIRNIEYTSNADVAYDTAIENSVTCGVGYWRVKLDYAHDDSFDMDLCIDRIANVFSVYGDPHSVAADSSDWNSAFVTEMIKKTAFEKKYKGAKAVDWQGMGYTTLKQPWSEGEQIMLAEYWTREEVSRLIVALNDGSIIDADRYKAAKDVFDVMGLQVTGERTTKSWKVRQYLMTGAEVLEKNDWAGKYIPIIPVYGDEINVEGKRYFRSLIRDAKDPQRMFNYWRTTSTEMVALAPKAPFIGPKGAFKSDLDKWNTANTQSHAFIEYDGQQPPQRQGYAGPPAGAIQEALNAADDLKAIMGIYDASLGARGNETSGRAILARQHQGNTSTFHFIDNLARAIRHTGRILIDLIPTVYTGDRIIRVLGPEGDDPKTVPLGKPTQTKEGIEKIYDLTVGKYDLVVETGPSFSTKREEAATQMTELIRVYPQAAPLIGDLLAKNLDWPGADEIAKRMKAMLPHQVQGQDPMAQQMQQVIQHLQQQLGQMGQQLQEVQKDKAIESRKVDVDAFNAETNRLKITTTAMGPEQVQMLVMQTLQQVLTSPDILTGPQQGAMPQGMSPQFPPQPASPQQAPVANPAAPFTPTN